jgi:transposase-like protein
MSEKESAAKAVRDIRGKTRRRFSAEEKIRIVIEGLRGEISQLPHAGNTPRWTREGAASEGLALPGSPGTG